MSAPSSSNETTKKPEAAAADASVNEPALYSVRELHKEYQMQGVTVPVLRGCDLEVRRGEILSIIGLSGVGKTTLLNIMGLLDNPTLGKLIYSSGTDDSLQGCDLAELSLKKKCTIRNRHFGFVFQFYHLLPDLTVLENVLLPSMIALSYGEYRGRQAELQDRARGLLDRVGVIDRSDFPPSRLSGGERQRVAIARALMNDPELVFCDEPTGNLDTATGDRIHELILELNRELGTGFILVTHDQGLANLASRILTMRDGRFEGQ
jgi:lipoprotein-releasing system ATP-binding protein